MEADILYNTTTTAMIHALNSHFARWGNLSTIVSDNGSQYTADKFREFTAKWDPEHWTSAPGHGNASGKTESCQAQRSATHLHKEQAVAQHRAY